MRKWIKSGAPWVWLTAGGMALALVLVFAVLWLTAARGLVYFWPSPVVQTTYTQPDGKTVRLIGEVKEVEEVSRKRLADAGFKNLPGDAPFVNRLLFKLGNRDLTGADFKWFPEPLLGAFTYPRDLLTVERHEWGNFYGHLVAVTENGRVIASGEAAWPVLQQRVARADRLFKSIHRVEKVDIGNVNYELEQLRLQERRLQLRGKLDTIEKERIANERAADEKQFAALQQRLEQLRTEIARDAVIVETASGDKVTIPLAKVAQVYRPNDMSFGQKIGFYFAKLWAFITEDPREANTEGGIFPAIFGTVMMVMLMTVLVMPLGVVAAVYMREYAGNGPMIRIIRIAVNNLAGVPSIVYGVFGLGFFVYFLGGNIDRLFFAESLPAPTFGSPGILWASLTLAILTLPVVIVSTEEGLARVPRSLRDASLALGATKAETLWRTVLPMASPAMMTGLILAVARAAGETAPLMLVGVVKLAPNLPLDSHFPYFHLERQFMHLGFHIYDVGFQSPNVEAARPLVYATAFLLVLVIVALNLTAVSIRNRLREKYRGLESI
ncbi:phosphate ABC transporter permease PstA [Thiomonas sp.]|uniref:phosphate ABC transporter permease PstA n=1 Tax=Thiomonas sp. TaxID=2047785 RepID=UPI0026233EA1|nr:phosphate ABC transporter permease PstA [Thiomonas sp.]